MATIITDKLVALLQSEGLPPVELLTPESAGYAERRELRDNVYPDVQPVAIAVPKDAAEVSRIVKWATSNDLKFTVRGGGNDFFGRSIADGALAIDLRSINSVSVSADKKTATIGGGIISRDLILALEAEGLMTPTANTWIVGYAGWASNGGYGPIGNKYGMGIEQIVGAELVNAAGDVVVADEEMLEGVRGMVGHLGVITSLTIKVYPHYQLLAGFLAFESSDIRKTITSYLEARPNLPLPKELTVHDFVIFNPQAGRPVFTVIWTWASPEIEKGKAVLQAWKDSTPPLLLCNVEVLPAAERYGRMPLPQKMKGGHRCLYLRRLPTADDNDALTAALLEAVETMPAVPGANIAWSDLKNIDPAQMPPNCFLPQNHSYLSNSFMVADEAHAEASNAWSAGVIEKLTALGEDAIVTGGYPATTPPGEKTAERLYGERWARVKELKMKYDPTNVFSLATPRIDL